MPSQSLPLSSQKKNATRGKITHRQHPASSHSRNTLPAPKDPSRTPDPAPAYGQRRQAPSGDRRSGIPGSSGSGRAGSSSAAAAACRPGSAGGRRPVVGIGAPATATVVDCRGRGSSASSCPPATGDVRRRVTACRSARSPVEGRVGRRRAVRLGGACWLGGSRVLRGWG